MVYIINYKKNILNFKINQKKILFFLLFVFIFFPYINILNVLKTDTQPNALVISLIINFLFFPYLIRINKKFIFLIIPFIFGLFLFPFSIDYIYGLREIGGYISVLSISISIYIFFKKYNGNINIENFICYSILIWLISGILQKFFYSQFSIILPRLSTSSGRGSTSLAPEPSYYGLMLMFFLWCNFEFINGTSKKILIYILIILQLIFIAKSGIYFFTLFVILAFYLIIFIILFFFTNMKIKYNNLILSIFLSLIVISFFIISFQFLKNTRLFDIMNKISKNPLEFFTKDRSAFDRLNDITSSFKGFIKNFGFPHLFGDWKTFMDSSRIKSLWGSVLFNLGFIGFLYIFLFNLLLFIRYKNIKIFLFFFIYFNFIFISQVPMAHPFVGFIYGYFIYKTEILYFKINNEDNYEFKEKLISED